MRDKTQEKKTEQVMIRFTPSELKEIQEAAQKAKLPLATYLRQMILLSSR